MLYIISKCPLLMLLFCFPVFCIAQGAKAPTAVLTAKRQQVFAKVEDSLAKQFEKQNLSWPPQGLYIRSFKYDRELEVWVQAKFGEVYKLFKSYKVCMQSGSTGPKRIEGDYQVPEGFYYINEFNPNSNYHLSLGLNYPNGADKILSDVHRPGSAIYIHGNCVSTGCIPIRDEGIEELYTLASFAKASGQEFIPVHVFPIKYSVKKSVDYLETAIKENPYLQQFNKNIKEVFNYFETNKKLPLIMVNKNGEYVFN